MPMILLAVVGSINQNTARPMEGTAETKQNPARPVEKPQKVTMEGIGESPRRDKDFM